MEWQAYGNSPLCGDNATGKPLFSSDGLGLSLVAGVPSDGSTACTRHHHTYWVYILTNHARTLYIGVTNDIERRIRQHREETTPGFTKRYHVNKLVYYETFQYVRDAIDRENQLKGWTRAKKVALIERENAGWLDLAAGRFAPGEGLPSTEGTTPRAS